MIPIKHIETGGNGVMLSENIEGQRILEIQLGGLVLSPNRLHFTSELSIHGVLEQLDRLGRCLGTVAEGLRAQIEEGESA